MLETLWIYLLYNFDSSVRWSGMRHPGWMS